MDKRKAMSMKDIIIIIAIIAIIVAGDVYTKKYLYKTSDELIEDMKSLKQKTVEAKENNNRNEIIQQINNIEKKWNNTTKAWSTIVVHQEIDNIEQALIKTKANIEDGELEVAIQEIETTRFFLEHVKDREKLSLRNIF